MPPLRYTHCDILFLADSVGPGPIMPPPECMKSMVADLLNAGLLVEIEGRAEITEAGRLALAENADRMVPL